MLLNCSLAVLLLLIALTECALIVKNTRYNWNKHCNRANPRDLKHLAQVMARKKLTKALIGPYDLAILTRKGSLRLVPYLGDTEFPILCPRAIKSAAKPPSVPVSIITGDITDLDGFDAIVNAANERCLGGGGVDRAIHQAAGKALKQECKKLPFFKDGMDPRYKHECRCPTGQARITKGFRLSRLVIHAVAPRYDEHPREQARKLLVAAVLNTLNQAHRFDAKRIAIPAIGMNSFKFPIGDGALLICAAIKHYLKMNPHNQFREIAIVLSPNSNDYKQLRQRFTKAIHDLDI